MASAMVWLQSTGKYCASSTAMPEPFMLLKDQMACCFGNIPRLPARQPPAGSKQLLVHQGSRCPHRDTTPLFTTYSYHAFITDRRPPPSAGSGSFPGVHRDLQQTGRILGAMHLVQHDPGVGRKVGEERLDLRSAVDSHLDVPGARMFCGGLNGTHPLQYLPAVRFQQGHSDSHLFCMKDYLETSTQRKTHWREPVKPTRVLEAARMSVMLIARKPPGSIIS